MFNLKILIFISFIPIFASGQKTSQPPNWCNEKNIQESNKYPLSIKELAEDIDFNWTFRNGESCYFHISHAETYVDVKENDGGIESIFSLAKGRELCQKYFGTLPTIKDEAELKFLRKIADEWSVKAGGTGSTASQEVPLGLTKIFGQRLIKRWDDNLTSKYAPDLWENGESLWPNDFTCLGARNQFITRPGGHSFHFIDFILLFCKQARNNGLKNVTHFVGVYFYAIIASIIISKIF